MAVLLEQGHSQSAVARLLGVSEGAVRYHRKRWSAGSADSRHRGEDQALLAARHALYEAARERHPERWSGTTRNWQPVGSVWLNPERDDNVKEGQWVGDALTQKAGGDGPLAGRKARAA